MKVKIGEYVVEINARKEWHEQNNQKDTEAFLTHLACAFWDASHHMENKGFPYTAKGYKEDALSINDYFDQKKTY